MKKMILAAFIFLLICPNGISQQEPRLIKYVYSSSRSTSDTFNIKFEENYDYDFFGNQILEIQKEYNKEGDIIKWEGIFNEYDSNQFLKKKSYKYYNSDVDLWITNSWIEYSYDMNNCLVEEVSIVNIGGIYSKTTSEVNENCQWIYRRSDIYDAVSDTFSRSTTYFERTYFSDDISYEERLFHYDSSGDSSYLSRTNVLIFNDKGNLIEKYSPFFFSQYNLFGEKLELTEYDDFDNLKFHKGFTRLPDSLDWEPSFITEFINEYDENNFLIGTKLERTSPITATPTIYSVFKYENSCVGIQELVDMENGSGGERRRIENTYEGINDCIDLERIDLKIEVFPNPSNGYFEISSPIFQAGNTEILVYSIGGKILLQKNESSRCEASFIDLTSVQNGIYILQLQNGKHFVNEKIVIAN
jgi:hypothetical protein